MQHSTKVSTLLSTGLAGLLVAGGLAACGGGGDDSMDANDPAEDPIQAQCDLDVSKTVREGGASPGPLTYQIEVSNSGVGECEEPITVEDTLPPGILFDASSSPDWDCSTNSSDPQQVSCDYANGALESSTNFELQAQMTREACMASNCATASSNHDVARDCARTDCGSHEACVDPPEGMVGWWTGDQTADDETSEQNDGTLNGGAHYATGQVREAFGFEGNNDRVEVPDDPTLNFAGEDQFSIDAWIHPDGFDENPVQMIVDKRESTSDGNIGYALQLRSGSLIVRTQNDSSAVTHTASGTIPAGEWTHVTVTVDLAADQGRVFLDGAQDSTFQPSSTGAGDLSNEAPLFIGRHFDVFDQAFDGRIDEVEIFSRLLNEDEIAALADAGPCGKCRIDCFDGEETFTADGSDGSEADPSDYLQQNFQPTKGFGENATNRNFAHTFTGLKPSDEHQRICDANLQVVMQPTSGETENDAVNLSVSDNGNVEERWHNHIGTSNGLTGFNWTNSLQSDPWTTSEFGSWETFDFNLANLPPTDFNQNTVSQDLIDEIDEHEMLNVRIQDDTEVQSAQLVVEYCCDDGGDDGDTDADVVGEKRLDDDLTVGETSTYTISVSNQGDAQATPPIEVRDEIPECLEIESIQAPWNQWCSINGQSVECEYQDPLAPGTQATDLQIDVTPTDNCGDLVENCATVTHDDDETETCSESEVSQDTGEQGADLSVDKRAVEPPFAWGQTASYEITVENAGPNDAQEPVTVTDNLHSCLSFVGINSSNWSCSASNGVVECQRTGTFPAGASETFTLDVETTDACGDAVENCATVASDTPPTDPNTANNESCTTTEFTRAESDLGIAKSPDGDLNFGAVNTYELRVKNMGPATDHGPITVTDDLPSCMEFDSASPAAWSCSTTGSAPTQTVTCTHPGPLAASSTEVLDLNVQHISGDPDLSCGDRVENCATVDSSNTDPVSDNNQSCDTSPLR